MFRISARANHELLEIPGVRNAGSHIGQALLMDEVVGIDFGENWISVDPSVDYDETLAKIQEVVDGYPGLNRDVLTYLKERIREVLTGSSEAITIRIYGQDLPQLQETADEVNEILGSVPGVTENHVESLKDIPQVSVVVDLAAAQRYGLKPGDVRRTAARLLAGEEVGDIFRDGKAYDVQVWSSPETRDTYSDIENLLFDTPSGEYVQLKDVADVTIEPVPNVIYHDALFRSLDVGANIDGTRDLGSIVADVESRLDDYEWPAEYHAEFLGEYTERKAAANRLNVGAIAAAIGIFLLLQASFGSWRSGDALVPDPADRADRWGLGRIPDRRGHLARFARRLLHRARHRRPERDHADQPLPASRTLRRACRSARSWCCRAPASGSCRS